MIVEVSSCRICGNNNLVEIIDLGIHSLSCRFPYENEDDPVSAPLILVKCDDSMNDQYCGLVQLKHNVSSDELYLHNYGYRSGLNKTMTDHLTNLTSEVLAQVTLNSNDIILDIGSNDCTLLKSYNNHTETSIRRIGIDPTGTQFKDFYPNDIQLVPDFFTYDNFVKVFPEEKAKIITSISMFYDLPDPLKFMSDIKNTLHKDGLWVCEQSYIVTMLERFSFDTICHEHLEYYAYKQIEWMGNNIGLKIVDVQLNECNGGSFKITFAHSDSQYIQNIVNIEILKNKEIEMKLNTLNPYNAFKINYEEIKQKLVPFLRNEKQFGRSIYLYGASTKGNTLLQYYDIDNTIITAAAERNTEKFGRRTPKTNIPIVSENEMRKSNPDYLLVLPWHFREEFIQREKEYLDNGGQLIFPLPKMEIYTNKKKALITGVCGQIGRYLAEQLLEKDYIVYGVVHKTKNNLNPRVHYIDGDLTDLNFTERIILSIMPDEIYNLAGETNSFHAIDKPMETFDINARVVNKICETIYLSKKNIKLFEANSIELYKGVINGLTTVNEDTKQFHPDTPYGYAKLSSYWIIRYYREKYGCQFFNGILSNIESPFRKDTYITQKINKYINNIKTHIENHEALQVGNLDIQKDWLHASDAANAMYLMLQQDTASDYIISSFETNTIRTLIDEFFKKVNMNLSWYKQDGYENGYCNNLLYVHVNSDYIRKNEKVENVLLADNSKLKSIGWIKQYSLTDIVNDFF
jgi:NDP-4-keto-2,6-dideoxyhexose 3-C-methyltransferase